MKVIDDGSAFRFRKGVLGSGDGVDGGEDHPGETAESDYVLGEDDAGDAAVGGVGGEDGGELPSEARARRARSRSVWEQFRQQCWEQC